MTNELINSMGRVSIVSAEGAVSTMFGEVCWGDSEGC